MAGLATRCASQLGMAVVGCAASFALIGGALVVLAPWLSFAAVLTAPFAALAAAAVAVFVTSVRRCNAPEWAQRGRTAFWAGVFANLLYFCVGIAISHSVPILA